VAFKFVFSTSSWTTGTGTSLLKVTVSLRGHPDASHDDVQQGSQQGVTFQALFVLKTYIQKNRVKYGVYEILSDIRPGHSSCQVNINSVAASQTSVTALHTTGPGPSRIHLLNKGPGQLTSSTWSVVLKQSSLIVCHWCWILVIVNGIACGIQGQSLKVFRVVWNCCKQYGHQPETIWCC